MPTSPLACSHRLGGTCCVVQLANSSPRRRRSRADPRLLLSWVRLVVLNLAVRWPAYAKVPSPQPTPMPEPVQPMFVPSTPLAGGTCQMDVAGSVGPRGQPASDAASQKAADTKLVTVDSAVTEGRTPRCERRSQGGLRALHLFVRSRTDRTRRLGVVPHRSTPETGAVRRPRIVPWLCPNAACMTERSLDKVDSPSAPSSLVLTRKLPLEKVAR